MRWHYINMKNMQKKDDGLDDQNGMKNGSKLKKAELEDDDTFFNIFRKRIKSVIRGTDCKELELFINHVRNNLFQEPLFNTKDRLNISKLEYKGYCDLRKMKGVIVTKQDKGDRFVVLEYDDYVSRMIAGLNKTNWIRCNDDGILNGAMLLLAYIAEYKDFLLGLKFDGLFRDGNKINYNLHIKYRNWYEFLVPFQPYYYHYNTSQLYGLVKTHKKVKVKPLRIITSSICNILKPLDLFIYNNIRMLINECRYLALDTKEVVGKTLQLNSNYIINKSNLLNLEVLNGSESFMKNVFCFSLDVTKLYPSINWNHGISILKVLLHHYKVKYDIKDILIDAILKGIKILLENEIATFGGAFYRLSSGGAMGKHYMCAFTDLVMHGFDIYLMNHYNDMNLMDHVFDDIFGYHINNVLLHGIGGDNIDNAQVLLIDYMRYRDDLRFIIYLNDDYLKHCSINDYTLKLQKLCNSWYDSINFTIDLGKDNMAKMVHFLDLWIEVGADKINIDLFVKKYNSYSFLHRRSFHPRMNFKGVMITIPFRIVSIVDDDKKIKWLDRYRVFLLKRGYKENELSEFFDLFYNISRSDILNGNYTHIKKLMMYKNLLKGSYHHVFDDDALFHGHGDIFLNHLNKKWRKKEKDDEFLLVLNDLMDNGSIHHNVNPGSDTVLVDIGNHGSVNHKVLKKNDLLIAPEQNVWITYYYHRLLPNFMSIINRYWYILDLLQDDLFINRKQIKISYKRSPNIREMLHPMRYLKKDLKKKKVNNFLSFNNWINHFQLCGLLDNVVCGNGHQLYRTDGASMVYCSKCDILLSMDCTIFECIECGYVLCLNCVEFNCIEDHGLDLVYYDRDVFDSNACCNWCICLLSDIYNDKLDNYNGKVDDTRLVLWECEECNIILCQECFFIKINNNYFHPIPHFHHFKDWNSFISILDDFTRNNDIELEGNKKAGYFYCENKKCRTCGYFNTFYYEKNYILSSVFNIKLDLKLLGPISCDTKGIIYCIMCTKCLLQYVGSSINSSKTRMSAHKSCIRNNRNCAPEYDHFINVHSDDHKSFGNDKNLSYFSFLVLENIDLSNYNLDNIWVKQYVDSILNLKEKMWQSKLGLIYNRHSSLGSTVDWNNAFNVRRNYKRKRLLHDKR